MGAPRSWYPSWIADLALPIWITGPNGELDYWNQHAQRFLDGAPSNAIGRPCFEVIAATDARGDCFCDKACRVRQQARRKAGFGPFHVKLGQQAGTPREATLVVIRLSSPSGEGPWLCHMALSTSEMEPSREFISKVATRTLKYADPGAALLGSGLSTRESNVLRLLASDRTMKEVAFELSISYDTVRNHAKNIRSKLGVHRTDEAVACFLLAGPQEACR